MQQATVIGSSPVLHAADQMRNAQGNLVLPRRVHPLGQVHAAKPIPLPLVAKQIRLVGRDFLQQRIPLAVLGMEPLQMTIIVAEVRNAGALQPPPQAVRQQQLLLGRDADSRPPIDQFGKLLQFDIRHLRDADGTKRRR